jgi:hypothetical protein
MNPGNDPRIITGDRDTLQKTSPSSLQTPSEVYDAKLQEQRKLSDEWNAVVEKMRCIDGFSNFLEAVPFTTLQNAAAAAKRPIVVITNILLTQSSF